MALGPMAVLPLMIFGGLFLNSGSVPIYFVPLEALSFIKYAFHALSTLIFDRIEPISCEQGSMCRFRTGADVLNFYSVEKDDFVLNIVAVVVFAVVVRGLAFLALARALKKSR